MTKQRKDFMKQVSDLLRQGKSRKEIENIVDRDRAWISKIIKQMREECPELLEGTAEAPKEQEKAPEEPHNKPIQAKKEQERTETQMLSFRANTDDLRRWKSYAGATDYSLTELLIKAVNRFINDNTLSGDEKIMFDILMRRGK